jgi:phenylacetyl-CoA:acceptor oxidoreductase subunit 2
MSFGPNPWQQAHWDWRAAGNFIGGGAGSGLLFLTVMSGATGGARAALLLAALALVGAGLFCVWLEIGRPMRALHVFFHPQRSWMSREAFVAVWLFPAGLAAAAGIAGLDWVAAFLAAAFLYCQSRILVAARGIPAWREPALSPLVVGTGLAEGAGLLLATSPWTGLPIDRLPLLVGVLVLLRLVAWTRYRKALAGRTAPGATRALEAAGRVLKLGGTLVPIVLLVPLMAGALPEAAAAFAAFAAGTLALLAGAWTKYELITRAGHNQGFALTKLPVRGVPR